MRQFRRLPFAVAMVTSIMQSLNSQSEPRKQPSAVAIYGNAVNSTANQKCDVIILHNTHVFIMASMLAHGYNAHTYLIIVVNMCL